MINDTFLWSKMKRWGNHLIAIAIALKKREKKRFTYSIKVFSWLCGGEKQENGRDSSSFESKREGKHIDDDFRF